MYLLSIRTLPVPFGTHQQRCYHPVETSFEDKWTVVPKEITPVDESESRLPFCFCVVNPRRSSLSCLPGERVDDRK